MALDAMFGRSTLGSSRHDRIIYNDYISIVIIGVLLYPYERCIVGQRLAISRGIQWAVTTKKIVRVTDTLLSVFPNTILYADPCQTMLCIFSLWILHIVKTKFESNFKCKFDNGNIVPVKTSFLNFLFAFDCLVKWIPLLPIISNE